MKILREQLDKLEKHFGHEGKLKKFFPIYEAIDTFLYSPDSKSSGKVHVRDGMDLKRMMITVAVALTPCALFGTYNVGLQANLALASTGATAEGWRAAIVTFLGLGFDPQNILACFVYGLTYFLPIFLVCNLVGGLVEVIFSTVRGHEVNEGFLVTGMLFPLTLPPTIPLWQVAVAIIFAVVFAKEVFGGTGKNFINIALMARAFLYFAYPGEITGDAVWVAVDGYTAATPLGQVALGGPQAITANWHQAFWGFIPGSIGETSAFACLLGAAYLIWTGIGSWRTMFGVVVGFIATISLFNFMGSESNPAFALDPWFHMVIGGFAFGTVFMATDPVTSAVTDLGKLIYGFLIGFMTALVRVINPAFPEGIMLAILFGNVFAPFIDWIVMRGVIARRARRQNV
jgi:Na+-transporting NADH:ubiquinone oxidoreductase subunit B